MYYSSEITHVRKMSVSGVFVCLFSSFLADQGVFIMKNLLNKTPFYYLKVDLEQISQLFFRVYTCIMLGNDRF